MDSDKLFLLVNLYHKNIATEINYNHPKQHCEILEDWKYLKEKGFIYIPRDTNWRASGEPQITETGKKLIKEFIKILDN